MVKTIGRSKKELNNKWSSLYSDDESSVRKEYNESNIICKTCKIVHNIVKQSIDGDIFWYSDNQLHRDNGPAVEYVNNDKEWYHHGKHHRENGPAVIKANGDKEWWWYSKLHRVNGPAIEYTDGRNYWYQNDKRHSLNGPASSGIMVIRSGYNMVNYID